MSCKSSVLTVECDFLNEAQKHFPLNGKALARFANSSPVSSEVLLEIDTNPYI